MDYINDFYVKSHIFVTYEIRLIYKPIITYIKVSINIYGYGIS